MKNLVLVLIGFVLFSCGSNSFETESGVTVSYLEKGSGGLPVDSLVGLYCIGYTTEDGKMMMEADVDNPIPLQIDPVNSTQLGVLYPILSKLRTGDSVAFEVVASELFEKTFRAPLPDSIAPESKIKFQIAFLEQLTETELYDKMAKKQAKLAEKQLVLDAEILDNYLADNNIEAITTESGLRYVITEEGSGPKPESGQMVEVAYTGRLLTGEVFDTSNEDLAKELNLYNPRREYVPYAFALETGAVIQGWHIGIALLNVGSKATLFIPSSLGYQDRGSGIIQPNSILVFDVELVAIQ
ncbi:MAG: FKBP-type peptidyl-prolyl cis-trans isomerase [Cyclobacteriaceae bacterium]